MDGGSMRRIAALVFVALTLVLASPAEAQQTYTGGSVPNAGSVDTGGEVSSSDPGGRTAVAQSRAPVRLALTGGDVVGLVLIGVVLVGLGAGVVTASRRRARIAL